MNKRSEVSKPHSPSLETIRKWSHPSFTITRGEEGGQLARAAAYIRERRTGRASAFDEFPSRNPKVPPDKLLEMAPIATVSRRLMLDVVSKEAEARAAYLSPTRYPESQELSFSLSEAVPDWMGLNPVAPMEDNREVKPQQHKQAIEADRCSVEHLVETQEVSEELVMPAHTETVRFSRESLVEEREQVTSLVVSKIEISALFALTYSGTRWLCRRSWLCRFVDDDAGPLCHYLPRNWGSQGRRDGVHNHPRG